MLWSEIRLQAASFVVAALAANAAKTWVSLPIRGPARLADYSLNRHQADVSIGTPPQNTSFVVSISLTPLYTLTPQCLFCPPEGMYDLRYSSSAKRTPEKYTGRNTSGTYGTEAITLGGVLQDEQSPLIFIDRMAPYHSLRYTGGLLGLFVPPTNATSRAKNLVHRLYEQDQLLNPVWGLRLSGENPRLTIGALDPNEYQGEINWVPLVPTEDGGAAVQIDSLRGYQGNVVPLQYPITAYLDSITRSINLLDLEVVLTQAILGPQPIYRDQSGGFAVACNNSETPNHPVEFSVGINGVVYPINQSDLVRAESSLSPARNTCYVGIHESLPDDSSFLLGITFLRSVYVAYRFPTETCPGYWGFATPRGSPVASPTQTPRTTPTDVDKCLSFVKPTSTPAPTIASYTGLLGSDGKEYEIHARPDEQWVQLRGADEMKERKVTGGKAGFGG